MGSKGEINTYNLFDKDFFSPIQLSFLIWLQRQWNQDYLNTTSHFTETTRRIRKQHLCLESSQ